MGRPRLWETVEDFEKAADGFWEWCDDNDYIPDIEGLCVYMGTFRERLHYYEKDPAFRNSIKRIKEEIFHAKKQKAFKNKINATVFIFDAKNNHNYTDKTEVAQTTTVSFEDKVKTLGESELQSMLNALDK